MNKHKKDAIEKIYSIQLCYFFQFASGNMYV